MRTPVCARVAGRAKTARDPAEFAAALQAEAGRRTSPDLALRDWALEQTAFRINKPLWDRLEALGVAEFG